MQIETTTNALSQVFTPKNGADLLSYNIRSDGSLSINYVSSAVVHSKEEIARLITEFENRKAEARAHKAIQLSHKLSYGRVHKLSSEY